jgi:plastocyanin
VLGGALVAEFALRAQPSIPSRGVAGSVIMPPGVGTNQGANFIPATITLVIGYNDTLNFVNKDTVVHTVTATDNSFNSEDIKAGGTYSHQFTTPGTYTYYCLYHPWMKATVIVKAQGSSTTTSGGLVVLMKAGTGGDNTLNYFPSTFRLVVGTNNTVTFVNQDSTKHTVTANDGSFDSTDIAPGASWTHTFAAGTYAYHCSYHTWMKGTITVVSS